MKNITASAQTLYQSSIRSSVNACPEGIITDRILKIRNADAIFDVALRQRNMRLLIRLLSNDFFNISTDKIAKSLRISLHEKNLKLLWFTVKHGNFNQVDASYGYDLAIRTAVRYNSPELMKLLLKNPFVNPQALKDQAIYNARISQIKKLLLEDDRVINEFVNDESFHKTCQYGFKSRVEDLLRDSRVDPGSQSNKGFRLAAENGHYEIVKILIKDSRINPSDLDNYAIKAACQNNHGEIVKILLKDFRVSPKGILKYACSNNNLALVQFLLQDPRMHSQKELNSSLTIASSLNYFEIVDILLKNTSVDPQMTRDKAFGAACKNGNVKMAKRLFEDSRYIKGRTAKDLGVELNQGLKFACEEAQIQVVDFLLNETSVDPQLADYNPLVIASKNGDLRLLKRLLQDTRMKITLNSIFDAVKFGRLAALKFLLENYKMDFSKNITTAMKIAKKFKRTKVINFLSEYDQEKKLPEEQVS
jgi:hypothetical protein